jgi:hypothetical protein
MLNNDKVEDVLTFAVDQQRKEDDRLGACSEEDMAVWWLYLRPLNDTDRISADNQRKYVAICALINTLGDMAEDCLK